MPTADRAFEMARVIDRLTMRERVADAMMQDADAAAIVALVERYVPLKKAGANFSGGSGRTWGHDSPFRPMSSISWRAVPSRRGRAMRGIHNWGTESAGVGNSWMSSAV